MIAQNSAVIVVLKKAVVNRNEICQGCSPAELSGRARDLLVAKAEENDRPPHQSVRDTEIEKLVHDDTLEAGPSKHACRQARANTVQANGVAALQKCSDRRMGYAKIVDVRVQEPETCGARTG